MKPIELVENIETPILLEQGEDGLHHAKFLITTIGQRNKNGRVYPEYIAAREAQMSMRGDILGQDTHPMGTPKFTEQFLIWEKFMIEGDKEYAQAKIVPTKPDGENFILLAQAGAMVSCSRRGVGSVKESTMNGMKCQVVQEDYKLLGIDILPPHVQSDHNAYMYRFEAYEPNTEEPMELTLEQLREENGELVTQIEDAATQPLKEQVTQLEGQVETLTAEKETALKLAEETQTKLTEIETKVAEQEQELAKAVATFESLNEKINEAWLKRDEMVEQVNALTESDKAHKHLLEKVKGERAAWLILDELKTEPTVASVDAKFDEAKRKCDALIEHAVTPAGKTVYTGDENSELNGTPKPVVNAVLEKSKRIAKHVGV